MAKKGFLANPANTCDVVKTLTVKHCPIKINICPPDAELEWEYLCVPGGKCNEPIWADADPLNDCGEMTSAGKYRLKSLPEGVSIFFEELPCEGRLVAGCEKKSDGVGGGGPVTIEGPVTIGNDCVAPVPIASCPGAPIEVTGTVTTTPSGVQNVLITNACPDQAVPMTVCEGETLPVTLAELPLTLVTDCDGVETEVAALPVAHQGVVDVRLCSDQTLPDYEIVCGDDDVLVYMDLTQVPPVALTLDGLPYTGGPPKPCADKEFKHVEYEWCSTTDPDVRYRQIVCWDATVTPPVPESIWLDGAGAVLAEAPAEIERCDGKQICKEICGDLNGIFEASDGPQTVPADSHTKIFVNTYTPPTQNDDGTYECCPKECTVVRVTKCGVDIWLTSVDTPSWCWDPGILIGNDVEIEVLQGYAVVQTFKEVCE